MKLFVAAEQNGPLEARQLFVRTSSEDGSVPFGLFGPMEPVNPQVRSQHNARASDTR